MTARAGAAAPRGPQRRPSELHPVGARWFVGLSSEDPVRDATAFCKNRANTDRRSAIDARATRHHGYRISTIKRKQIEGPFGWMKTVGSQRKTRHCGRDLAQWFFVLTAAAYNLIRIPKILAAT